MKAKGSRSERELVHMFNSTGIWSAVRIAGSGLTKDPNPDVLAGNNLRYLAIECKAVKSTSKYLYPEEVDQIANFSKRFGAEAWFGIKFNNKGWFFLKPEQLNKSRSNNLFVITFDIANKEGLSFDDLLGEVIKDG
ncbi:MAG TPA: Holliday junction resolvase Hjc [Candidatus Nanoarchaeia archaeon]|nr:Holliday junction resolvase Hjc [Candidatus Nanoarchaeia archaeon]